MEKNLYRSAKNKVIGGVCGGMGDYFRTDPVIIRIFFVIALFTFPPAPFLAYLILWIVLPVEKPAPSDEKTVNGNTVESGSIPLPVNRPPDDNKNPASRTMSIIIALVLILLGIFFLLPDAFFRLGQFGALLVALFLVFIALRISINMLSDRNFSIVRTAVALAALSYAVFIALTQFGFVASGVFFEYTKNLIAAVIITVGIGMIFRTNQQKLIGAALTAVIFIFVGVYSFARGNYQPFNGFFQSMKMPHLGRWNFNNVTVNGFSGAYTMPDALSVNYKVDSAAGNLKISDTDMLLEYRGDGIAPSLSTNALNGIYSVNFENQASDTRLSISRSKPVKLDLSVSAGNLEAELANLNITDLNVDVNGGSAEIRLGENVTKANIDANLGNASVKLSRNAKITIKLDSSIAKVHVPSEFKNVNGEYVYSGNKGGEKEIQINASVSMGNLEFDF